MGGLNAKIGKLKSKLLDSEKVRNTLTRVVPRNALTRVVPRESKVTHHLRRTNQLATINPCSDSIHRLCGSASLWFLRLSSLLFSWWHAAYAVRQRVARANTDTTI